MNDVDFKIGDKVMADFGQYGIVDLRTDTIISETKTLWKTKNYSFSKDYFKSIRGLSEYHQVYVELYNDETYKEFIVKAKFRKDYYEAKNAIISFKPDQQKLFVEWYQNNIKEKA